jgi:hypothetical protein
MRRILAGALVALAMGGVGAARAEKVVIRCGGYDGYTFDTITGRVHDDLMDKTVPFQRTPEEYKWHETFANEADFVLNRRTLVLDEYRETFVPRAHQCKTAPVQLP